MKKKIKSNLELQADIYLGAMPKMTVMQPTVVNVDGPSESVSREEIVCGHSSPDYPRMCFNHTSEFCKKKCAFNSALQDVDDDGY